ncbi:hypothetical protein [Thalassospira marina]|uniref:hypothetical protein n=1 Tax=Thalassospira marina TaxID=2048283 RepID=UPI00157FB397|nr:hypothetical protein [Thalassospira marina]
MNKSVISASDMQAQASGGASQATRIEQSRAIAEVQGAIVVAQQRPRDITKAISSMEDSCRIQSLSEKAFFRFNRGGQTVSGPSIHLARELARCWGNIDYGIKELSRDDYAGVSEMQAFAWDLETNNRAETTFIVPHGRDTKHGVKKLTDLRDIYENNANAGARRLREMILGILPPWFVDDAKDICTQTLKDGGGIPLPKRITQAVDKYAELGIDQKRLAKKIGRPTGEWTAHDIAQLQVIYRSINNGEMQAEDEFPADGESVISADEIKKQAVAVTAKKQEPKIPETIDQETGEVMEAPEAPQFDPEQVGAWLLDANKAIAACQTMDHLINVWSGLQDGIRHLKGDTRADTLTAAKDAKKGELE